MQSTSVQRVSEIYVNTMPTLAETTHNYYSTLSLKPQKLRTAAYARVSSETEMQDNSLENQIIYYTNHIRSNPKYHFAGVYSDRGKTGTKIESRVGFKRLIRDCLNGNIDLILCKSISRFARNVVDTVETVRLLKDNGVRIIFEKENIDTADLKSEVLLVLIGAVAQEESRNTSENITWANTKRYEQGEVKFSRILGYAKDKNQDWIVLEEEAKVVREAFKEYLNGSSFAQISKSFIRKGYKKKDGKTDWNPQGIMYLLSNERYVGDAHSQKTYTIDYLSHKAAVNKGDREMYIIENHHEPIVDRETFEKVQELLLKNSKKGKTVKEKKKYPLSKRIVCGNCGANFQRFYCRGIATWRCGSQGKSNLLCNMKGVKEDEILKAMVKIFNNKYLRGRKNDVSTIITNMIKDIRNSVDAREFQQKQYRLELERALLEENKAIIKNNGKDLESLKDKRVVIEDKIKESEAWWNLFDEDDDYRNSVVELLESMDSLDIKVLKEKVNDINFLRAWVVRVKVLSPILFSVTWLNGEETEIELKK